MYFAIGDADRGIASIAWRIWWHGTSFYVKARTGALADFKVSMHGPDSFHARPTFIVGKDQSSRVSTEGSLIDLRRFMGSRFSGHVTAGGALHVMTFRFGAELFQEGMPSELVRAIRSRDDIVAGFAPAPRPGEATDVHLYLNRGNSPLPDEKKARDANAILGPLINKSGDTLTAIMRRSRLVDEPSPAHLLGAPPTCAEDRVRGFAATIDALDRLWIVEAWLSRSALAGHESGNSTT